MQLWWPSFEVPVYVDALPWWDREAGAYRDPGSGFLLPTWDEALDGLDEDAEPAVVMRFGNQFDIKGIIAPSADADRSVRYLAKYLTKSVADTYSDAEHPDPRYEGHIDRLHQELVFLPCSPECASWLRYGVQPKSAGPGLIPGMCCSASHDRENLASAAAACKCRVRGPGRPFGSIVPTGLPWSARSSPRPASKAGPETDRMAASVLADDGLPRFVWEELPVESADYVEAVMRSVVQTLRWRAEYDDGLRPVELAPARREGL